MSAEDLGRSLLGETETGTLDELLRSLQSLHQQTPHWTPFHIPPLDALLREHAQSNNDSSSTITTNSTRRTKPVFLELSSTAPSQGKTHLLYHITALAILPTHWPLTNTKNNTTSTTTTTTSSSSSNSNVPLNGKHSAVIILDTDARFDAHRLATIVSNHIASCFHSAQKPHPPSDAVRRVVKEALVHVHIFRPASLEALIATVAGLPSYLENGIDHNNNNDNSGNTDSSNADTATATTRRHYSSSRPLHSILLDSATAFYWPVKADEEVAKLAVQRPGMPKPVTASEMYARLTRALGIVSRRFCCLVVSTSWAISVAVPDGGGGGGNEGGSAGGGNAGVVDLRPVLPPLWVNAQMVRLGVRRVPVVPFRAGMSFEAAEEEDEKRMEVVNKSRFEVWVLGEGGRRERGGFMFRISDDGVEVGGV